VSEPKKALHLNREEFDREAARGEDCEIAFGADEKRGDVLIQFDRHVRCLRLAPQNALDLVEKICEQCAALGVVAIPDVPDDQKH